MEITFSSVATYLPQINDTLMVVGQLKQDCSLIPSSCGIRQSAEGQTTRLIGPPNPPIPTVIISTSTSVGLCSNVILDASSSYGSGLRTWSQISWRVTSDHDTAAIANSLRNVGDILYPITLSRELFLSGQYNFSLTLENIFLQSSTSSVLVTVNGDPNTPLLSLLGQNSYMVNPSHSLYFQVQGLIPSCVGTTLPLSYTWKVYLSSVFIASLASQSNDPRTFYLPAYSLAPQNNYLVVSTASTAAGGSASVNISVEVINGIVVATVAGGSTQTNPVNAELLLNASTSYDQNFRSSFLSFHWDCVRSNDTVVKSYCAISNLKNRSSSAVFSLPPFALSIGYAYYFTVNVTTVDGRFGTTTVLVTPTGVSSSQTVIIGSASYRINQQSSVSLNGRCIASLPCTSFWSVSGSGINPSLANITTTPAQKSFTLAQIRKSVSFPLGIKAGSLISGNIYSFQLSSYLTGYPNTLSYAVITVVVSGPPTSGSVVSSPSNGTALSTLFLVSSIGWTSPSGDYPLQYDFTYQTLSGSTSLQLALKSAKTSVSSTLASGSATNQFMVNVTGGVYSSYGAKASASTLVSVFASTLTGSELNHYVNNGTGSSLLSYNVDSTLSVVNTASSYVLSIFCGDAVNCSSLNRSDCGPGTLPQTCGSCLNGYVGVVGSSNLPCNPSNKKWSNSYCSMDGDCLYELCQNHTCIIPGKLCPNNCSAHGNCHYYDNYGSRVTNCLANSTNCQARCACFDNFGGYSCNSSSYDATQIEEAIANICSTLSKIYGLQDFSSQLLSTLLSSLYTAFSVYGSTSVLAFDSCLSVLSGNITKLADNGYIDSDQTINLMANLISDLTLGLAFQQNFSNSPEGESLMDNGTYIHRSDQVSTSWTSMYRGVIQYMTDGQYPINISTNSLNAVVNRESLGQLYNSTLILYNSYSTEHPSITLTSKGLDSCQGFSSGYAHYSIMQWTINPYANSSFLKSPLLRWTSSSTGQSSMQPFNSSAENDHFYLFMEYNTFLNLSLTASVFENRTVPACVIHDNNGYTDCPCQAYSYTDIHVTFLCKSVAIILCPPQISSTSRRLSDIISSDALGSTNVAEFGVITESLAAEFLNVNGAVVNLHAADGVIAFISILLFIFIMGLRYFSRWDDLDRKHILYVAKAKTKKSARGASDLTLIELRKRIDRAFLTGGLVLEDLNEDDAEFDRRRKWWRLMLIPEFLRKHQDLLVSGSFFVRFMHAVIRYHPYLCFFVGRSMIHTRTLRFLLLCKSLMVSLFTSTLIFGNRSQNCL